MPNAIIIPTVDLTWTWLEVFTFLILDLFCWLDKMPEANYLLSVSWGYIKVRCGLWIFEQIFMINHFFSPVLIQVFKIIGDWKMFLEMKFTLQPDVDFGLEQTDCKYLLSSISGFRRCVICGSIIHFDASVMGRVGETCRYCNIQYIYFSYFRVFYAQKASFGFLELYGNIVGQQLGSQVAPFFNSFVFFSHNKVILGCFLFVFLHFHFWCVLVTFL